MSCFVFHLLSLQGIPPSHPPVIVCLSLSSQCRDNSVYEGNSRRPSVRLQPNPRRPATGGEHQLRVLRHLGRPGHSARVEGAVQLADIPAGGLERFGNRLILIVIFCWNPKVKASNKCCVAAFVTIHCPGLSNSLFSRGASRRLNRHDGRRHDTSRVPSAGRRSDGWCRGMLGRAVVARTCRTHWKA